jgi:small conductance mechanosensitive channel
MMHDFTARLRFLAVLASMAAAPARSQAPPPTDPGGGSQQTRPLDIEPLLPSSDELFRREFWTSLVRDLGERLLDALPRILASLLVLVLFYLFARAAVRIVRRLLGRSRVDPAVGQLLLPLLKYAILGLGVIMALSQAGLNVGSLLAGVGVAGLAIGLAAQDTLANIVAGFTILSDRPFRIGDRVTIADRYGQVVQIGIRSTRLRTLEQLDVVLPNKEVIDHTIVNHTLTPNLRLGVPLSIGYKESVAAAREVLLEAIRDLEGVKEMPKPEVVLTRLADSGVELELRLWLEDPLEERPMLYKALERAKEALDAAGIEIPFPQRTLHFAEGAGAVEVRGTTETGDEP